MSVASVEDTRNAGWKANNFGMKLMEKMGWSKGEGLGKDGNGRTENIVAVRKAENLGLGASIDQAGQAGWSATANGFSGLLAALNNKYSGSADASAKKARKSKKRARDSGRAEKDAKDAPGKVGKFRPQYKKRLSSKNVGGYSEKDLACILGAGASAPAAEEEPTGRPHRMRTRSMDKAEEEGEAEAAAEPPAKKAKKSKTKKDKKDKKDKKKGKKAAKAKTKKTKKSKSKSA